MTNITTEYLFPTQVCTSYVPKFNKIRKDLIKWIYEYKSKHKGVAKISNLGGWQSKSKHVYEDEGFKPFEPYIIPVITSLVDEFKVQRNGKLVQMWLNINSPNSYNVSHRHPGADLSGVLWIKQIPQQGRFVFDNMDVGYRDAMLLYHTDPAHLMEHKTIPEYVPKYKDGTIIIFPSGLSHRVEINETNKDRISLSFNIKFNF